MAGPITAFFMALIVSGIIFGSIGSGANDFSVADFVQNYVFSGLPIGLATAFSAWVCIRFIWVKAMLRRESRTRGLWFGVLTGAAALVMMLYLVMWGAGLIDMARSGEVNISVNDIVEVLFAPLFLVFFGFIFGGFLALPAGGFIGWYFSRDSEAGGG